MELIKITSKQGQTLYINPANVAALSEATFGCFIHVNGMQFEIEKKEFNAIKEKMGQ